MVDGNLTTLRCRDVEDDDIDGVLNDSLIFETIVIYT
jgi:hypothetical protein